MQNVYLDLETFCTTDESFIAEVRAEIEATVETEVGNVRAPSNYKDQVKIDEWLNTIGAEKIAAIRADAERQIDAKIRATGLDGAFGCIAVIGYAIDDADPVAIYRDTTDPAKYEADLLTSFFYQLTEAHHRNVMPCFIGHHIIGFDLRFLFQRAVILGIKPPYFIPFQAKPWETDKVFDTMTAWAGHGNRVSLDKICRALGIKGKGDFDGSKVADAIRAGDIAKVADYCANGDVHKTREVHKRLTFA